MAVMTEHATGTIEGKTWDEKPFAHVEGGRRLAHASSLDLYHGDVEGEATAEWIVIYAGGTKYGPDGTPDYATAQTSFKGLQRVVGRVGERSGSFVLEVSGGSEGGETHATWSVVPGSGTGELRGLRGSGGFTFLSAERSSLTLEYDLD